jgi:hypothetical protein
VSDSERKKLLVGLEADFRTTTTALAVAQADFEKVYAAMWAYMIENNDGPPRAVVFSPDVTMH